MIEKVLNTVNIPYKVIDEDEGIKLIKVNAKIHILYMHCKGNVFLLERDYFEYIEGNSIPYAILCYDCSAMKLYYLRLNKNANWVKSCFNTCDKDSIYLGKEILKAQISENLLKKEFLKYK